MATLLGYHSNKSLFSARGKINEHVLSTIKNKMASEGEEEDIINLDSDSEQYELIDLERILSIPLEILTALEASEEFSSVPNALVEYVSAKQNEMKECEEVIQEYTDSLEQKDRDYRKLVRNKTIDICVI